MINPEKLHFVLSFVTLKYFSVSFVIDLFTCISVFYYDYESNFLSQLKFIYQICELESSPRNCFNELFSCLL